MTVNSITSRQCAAARALVDWSQEKLAEAAQVTRVTIANFENNTRIEPSQRNLLSIIASLEQAGVAFIPEDVEAGLGPGVRLRQLVLEYSNTLRQVGWGMAFPVRYKGQPCMVTIPREIIDDIARGNFGTPDQQIKIVTERLPEFLKAVEGRLAASQTVPSEITLTAGDFPRGTF